MAKAPKSHADLSSTHAMDQGYSWLVMAASFLILFIVLGQALNFGIYFVALVDHFQSTNEATALIAAICCTLMDMNGAVGGILQKRYGARAVIVAGSLLASTGLALSYFATEMWHLYLTWGMLTGAGYGLCIVPCFGVLPEYFEKHRYFVLSFSSVGIALGVWMFAPLNLFLIETFTWRGSMLIQAGLTLQIVVLGFVCKSRIVHEKTDFRSLIDPSLFKDRRFILVMLDGVVLGGGSVAFLSMINSLIIGRGMTPWISAELAMAIGAGSTVSRVLVAMVSHLRCTDRALFYTTLSFTGAIAIAGTVFCYEYWSFAPALFGFGFSSGAKYSLVPAFVTELFGVEKLVVILGYFGFFLGLGDFIMPLVAGKYDL